MSSIISGVSQQFYHTIPTEVDLITTTPSRDGIFKYLSQIDYYKFPEFILDILIKVEGHKPIDVTDGQGDEKQDILTLNTKGERCLTQCKHTVDYKSHYNGDDLDLLVAACMRKDCKEAIFVTNSDLTPQGKKYITDNEYTRGFTNIYDCPKIDYWNGFKIWDKIKNNQDIINKWFSGLGQVHGLRSFKFDLTIQELPFIKNADEASDAFEKLLAILVSKPWVKEVVNGLHYSANISNDYSVNIKRWFQFSGSLDINFMLPEDSLNFFHRPFYALTMEIIMSPKTEKYNPVKIKEAVVKKISQEVLNDGKPNSWWHMTTSQIKSIIYLHDIAEPREIDLASASTFIMLENKNTQSEYNYCLLSDDEFKLIENSEDTIWLHKKTGIDVVQMFEQKVNPVEQYNHQIMQYGELDRIANYNFYAVEKINSSMMMRIRRLLNHEWMAFQFKDDTLIWAIEPDTNPNQIKNIHDKINAVGLNVLQVKPEDAAALLKDIQKDLVPSNWMFTSELSRISYPIMINKRVFWLSKKLELDKPIDVDLATKLLQFKYGFENKYGFDNMYGKTQQVYNSLELRELLFEFFTFRGKRMLDIAIYNNPISINIRFSEGRLEPSNDLTLEYVNEFNNIFQEIKEVMN